MLRAGIVGLPNVGKSTLFNALTRTRKAETANYPFSTIEPNVGVVAVGDDGPHASPAKAAATMPATVEFVDVAGLVRGASKGEGLGNRFLEHIREVDVIVHVVRCFEHRDVVHVSDRLDPVADIETITAELVLSDRESLGRMKGRLENAAKGGEKEAAARAAVAERLLAHLDEGKPAITRELAPGEKALARSFFLLTMKPTVFACNVAEADPGKAGELPLVKKVADRAARHYGSEAVAVSARSEAERAGLPEAEAAKFLGSIAIGESGADRLIRAVFRAAAAASGAGT